MKRKNSRGKLIYKDEYGNTLYMKRKGKNRVQYAAYNAEGKLVNEEGLAIMMERAGVNRGYYVRPVTDRGARILEMTGDIPVGTFDPYHLWRRRRRY